MKGKMNNKINRFGAKYHTLVIVSKDNAKYKKLIILMLITSFNKRILNNL